MIKDKIEENLELLRNCLLTENFKECKHLFSKWECFWLINYILRKNEKGIQKLIQKKILQIRNNN